MTETAKPYDPTKLGKSETEVESALTDEHGNTLPTFDEKYKQDFEGLLYIGALIDEFDWLGHHFVIRTLKDGELLAIGQIIKPYLDGPGGERAFAMATAAMCIESVDGEELPIPIGESRRVNEWAHQRFEYVRDNWFPTTTDAVYSHYVALNNKVRQVVEAMGKASAPEAQTLTSSAI